MNRHCLAHNQLIQYYCTFQGCTSNMMLCETCKKNHSRLHYVTIISKSQLVNMIKNVETNLNEQKRPLGNLVLCKKNSIENSKRLTSIVQILMKCMTEQQQKYNNQFFYKIQEPQRMHSKKIEQLQPILEYFNEIEKNSLQGVVTQKFGQKGWKKLKTRLHKLVILIYQCKNFLFESQTIIKQTLNTIAEQQNKQMTVLDKIKQHLILQQQNKRQNNFGIKRDASPSHPSPEKRNRSYEIFKLKNKN